MIARRMPKFYCDLCKWNYTHVMKDCNQITHMQRVQDYSTPQIYKPRNGNMTFLTQTSVHKKTRPVLGAQPPAAGTQPLRYTRYTRVNANKQGLEIVSAQPYFLEEEPPLIDINFEILITQPDRLFIQAKNSMNDWSME